MTRPSPTEFRAFATAVGRRYGDRVGVWSIWNEPNHPEFLRPQFVHGSAASPRIYRKLFLAGSAACARIGQRRRRAPLRRDRAARDAARRRAAGVPARRAVPRPHLPPRAPLRALEAGGYAHHAYTTRVGPRFRPPDRDDVTIGVLSRLTRALDRAGRAGAIRRGLGIYLTEFGIQSTPDPFVGVSLARQAEYLAIAERIAYLNPRVKSFSQYLLRDDEPRKGRRVERYGGFESGLRRSDGRAKPAYDAFRLPLAAEAYGRSDVLWGRVRPQPAQTRVTILASRRKGRPFRPLRTVTTNHRGVFGLRAKHHDKPSATACAGPRPAARSGSARRSALPRSANPFGSACVGRSVRRAVPFAILAGCLGVGVLPAFAADTVVSASTTAGTRGEFAVKPGEQVTWANASGVVHNLTVDGTQVRSPGRHGPTARQAYPARRSRTSTTQPPFRHERPVYVNDAGTVPTPPTARPARPPSPTARTVADPVGEPDAAARGTPPGHTGHRRRVSSFRARAGAAASARGAARRAESRASSS